MKQYILAQKKKIEIDKWCEGCSITKDPGQEYIISWILQNGAWFRQAWEMSLCKNCSLSSECGHEVRQQCSCFKE
ncbi:MAG: hypothetical protein D8M58_09390 [Calditrichaeota bacterium]|nr:MAG: hypothetical protein DWQ03_08765 [Calditrichota bacterium]MBL1205600.1 hypothetical protein [Calditrichota bacterium]